MTEDQIILQASSYVAGVVGSWLKPKINEILTSQSKKIKEQLKINYHDLYENLFTNYLSRRFSKFYIIDTLVFPNQQTLFDKMYYPLFLNNARKQNEDGTRINKYPKKILEDHFRILIKDPAGMGKSTVLKKIFLECVRENEGIPVLIELRKLSKENTVVDELINQLNEINKKCDIEFVLQLVDRGDFIFLLDGFDEIPLAEKDEVVKGLSQFVEKAANNKFILTSRPETSLASFGGFAEFNIKPLSIGEAFELFKLFDFYSYKPISKKLIEVLNNQNNKSIFEFLNNPFLASLVYKTFDFKKDIPFVKEQFYRQVYDALFENHDLTKEGYYKREKHSGLHIDDFEKILRYIGYVTMRMGRVEYNKNELLEIIEKAKKFYVGINFKSSDFVKDLISTVPLFRQEGLVYKWAHKSIQDYFSALFIYIDAGDKKKGLITEFYRKGLHDNVIELFASMDYKTFRHTIVREFCEEVIEYVENSYQNYSMIPEEDLIERKQLSFRRILVLRVINESSIKQDNTYGIRELLTSDNDKWSKKVTELTNKFDEELNQIYPEFQGMHIITWNPTEHYIIFSDELHKGLPDYLKRIVPSLFIEKNPFDEELLFNDDLFECINSFENSFLFVNKDPNLLINQPTFFSTANKIIHKFIREDQVNIKNCQTEYEDILSEIQYQDSLEDFL